jgi:serine/threonine protein phosphatase PrpC
MLTAHGVSHRGRVRSTNEDAWLSALDLGLFVVADGMGGQNAGEVASAMAVDTIRGFVERTSGSGEVTWPFGVDPRLSPGANRVLTALKLANRRVFESGEDIERRGMGTTVVAALVEQQRLIYASVGDSRIYSSRHGELRQLTADDSWVSQLLANQPQFDPALLRQHPMRSVLTNVVGPKETLEFTVHERRLDDEGEVLLLCSDGLHGALADSVIGSILASGSDADAMAEQLVGTALEGPAADNITALVIRYMPGEGDRL